MEQNANELYDNELQILNGLALGDQGASRFVYQLHADGLFYLARNIVKDAEAAKDLVADVFLKLIDKPREFSTLMAVKGYLYISTANSSRNYLRSQKRRNLVELTDNVSDSSYILPLILKADLYSEVWIAFNQLPDLRRQILMNSVIEGKSIREIAQALGLPENTVSVHKRRALAFLQEILKDKLVLLAFVIYITLLIIKELSR